MPKNQEYESFNSLEENPVSSIIKKYQNHPSIKLIKTKNKSKTFRFMEINTDEIKKFIEKLNPKKASQKSDMSTNILKKNAAFFAKYICDDINTSIRSLKFHNELEEADIVPVHKKSQNFLKKVIDLEVFSRIFPKFTKDAYMTKYQFFSKMLSQSINAVFARVTVHSTAC